MSTKHYDWIEHSRRLGKRFTAETGFAPDGENQSSVIGGPDPLAAKERQMAWVEFMKKNTEEAWRLWHAKNETGPEL